MGGSIQPRLKKQMPERRIVRLIAQPVETGGLGGTFGGTAMTRSRVKENYHPQISQIMQILFHYETCGWEEIFLNPQTDI